MVGVASEILTPPHSRGKEQCSLRIFQLARAYVQVRYGFDAEVATGGFRGPRGIGRAGDRLRSGRGTCPCACIPRRTCPTTRHRQSRAPRPPRATPAGRGHALFKRVFGSGRVLFHWGRLPRQSGRVEEMLLACGAFGQFDGRSLGNELCRVKLLRHDWIIAAVCCFMQRSGENRALSAAYMPLGGWPGPRGRT